VSAIRVIDIYDYTEYKDKINISHEKNTFVYNLDFSTPRTSFFLEFHDYVVESPEDVHVEWIVSDDSYERHLDIDNQDEGWDTTFPFVTDQRQEITLRLTFATSTRPSSIDLVTWNQEKKWKKITLDPVFLATHAADDAPRIVTRAEWWADESLRYVPQWKVSQTKQEWEERGRTPRIIEETPEDQAERLQGDKEYYDIISDDNDANSVVKLLRYENGNKLQFPIRTAKKINRILIHHTAEQLKESDDATMVRAIYMYHTKTKWWWDIGYNFLIGQRGAIYEGRAWWAYVESAHAFANNLGTVGISVIGNYQELHLNRDQRAGLVDAIVWITKKYGIDVTEEATGMRACTSKESCIYKKLTTYRLAGHRDVWLTSCPGDKIYALIPEIRDEVATKVWKVIPVYNTDTPYRDPLAPEDAVSLVLKDDTQKAVSMSSVNSWTVPSPRVSLGGKTIKIRLSYPSDTLSFRSATARKAIVRMNAKILPFAKNIEGSVFLSGSSDVILKVGNSQYVGKTLTVTSDVVRIPSWNRVPTWDSTRRYNDNLFRGKLYISNQWGKLLVVNELPIEDYLKWLGEVSDSDHTEKIKTIIVAARGYAHFYARGENRKYNTKLYDGSDDPDSFQKYLGYGYEMRSPNVAKLVEVTKNQVITFQEKLIKPWYFSSSDGRTLSYQQYCQMNNPWKTCEDIPYLQSVDDPAGFWKVRAWHGVGISWIGASYGANNGKNYKQIIGYYMSGALIRNVNSLKN
jgi:hypothetical protein